MSLVPSTANGAKAGLSMASPANRPDGVPVQKGEYSVASRALALSSYFFSGALAINLSQFLGTPLYLVNEDWYNAWIAFTKQSFGLLTMTLTQAFAPTKVIVSGDASVRGQLQLRSDGNLKLAFPDRLVLIANHQIYTDWLYLWWIAYCNGRHGSLFIILKESLKQIPVLGWGMQLSQFIFLKRNWEKDRPHMADALHKLNNVARPMWLLIFPEGTNLAPSTREKSAAWAKKSGMKDMQHLLLPRSTGLQFCLQELKGVDYLYDCTIGYEGVPRGQYAQDIYTLKAGYLEGRPPKSVSMYWRRFAVKDIPVKDEKAFGLWLTARWREKDILMEHYMKFGRFPADRGATKFKSGEIKRGTGHLDVQIRSSHWYEFLQIFAPMGVLAMVLAVFYGDLPQRFWKAFNKQALQSGSDEIMKAGIQAGTQAKAISNSASALTLDDVFDKDRQEESFKKGAMMVQSWLKTPQAQTLMNRVDFVSQFIQNPQKTVTETVTGQRKDFMKAIKDEEQRRKKAHLPTSAQNRGSQQGTFWKHLEAVEKSRNGSVVSAPTSTPAGGFWADMQAAERRKGGGLQYAAKGDFYDRMKWEQNSRHGTIRTLSSDASTVVGSLPSGYSTPAAFQKAPSAPALTRRSSTATTTTTGIARAPPKLASNSAKTPVSSASKPVSVKPSNGATAASQTAKKSNGTGVGPPKLNIAPKKTVSPAARPPLTKVQTSQASLTNGKLKSTTTTPVKQAVPKLTPQPKEVPVKHNTTPQKVPIFKGKTPVSRPRPPKLAAG